MININLLPKRKDRRGLLVLIFWMILGLVFLLWHMILQKEVGSLRKESVCLQQELINVESGYGDKSQQQGSSISRGLRASGVRFFQMLQEVWLSIPQNVGLNRLIIKKQGVKMAGQAKSMFDLAEFVKKLQQINKGLPKVQRIDRQKNNYGFILLWSG